MSKLAKGIAVIGVLSMLAPTVFGVSVSDLQGQLDALLVQLHSLQAQLSALNTSNVFNFSVNLTFGSVGSQVSALQNFLVSQNVGLAALALARHGTTQNFGSLTKAALIEYQQSAGISPAIGYFGPITRNYINSLRNNTDNTNNTTTNTSGLSFSTSTTSNELIGLVPVVSTNSAINVYDTSAILRGETDSSAGLVGFDYGLTSSYGSETTSTGNGMFSSYLSGLSGNTTYHFRAKAKNSAGWGYGGDQTLTTATVLNYSVPQGDNSVVISIPTLTTDAATALAATTATLNGTITDEGGASSTITGFDYGLTNAYGTEATSTYAGGAAAFSKDITSLASNTTYHFRSKAKNSAGWGYGADAILTTALAPPTVTTNAATSVATSTATFNGSITSEGDASSTITGFDYGLTDSYGSEATSTYAAGVGAFNKAITGLTSGATYHLRAKSYNAGGWGYGSDGTLTTADQYAKLLLHMDGVNESTSFPDSSFYNHTMTAQGGVQVDTSNYKFPTGGCNFVSDGNYLSSATSEDWHFSTGDFTIDFWVKFNSLGTEKALVVIFDANLPAPVTLNVVRTSDNKLAAAMSTPNHGPVTTNAVFTQTGVWYHVAIEKSGGSTNPLFFINGVQQTITSSAWGDALWPADLPWKTTLYVGYSPWHGSGIDGYIDELRISKGIARWTSNFTPPTTPY
ncbi:MAG: LamG-like jellyroll fold domain-containing protein [Candidatus Paceibacterota bacterium]|jgi:hypothetical protein